MNNYNLFNSVERSYINNGVQGLPIEQGKRIDSNFIDLVNERSVAKNKHVSRAQLGAYIGNLSNISHQSPELNNFKCDSRKNNESYRFSYSMDLMNKRNINVSGLLIPANMIRNIPNIGISTNKSIIPFNKDIAELSHKLGDISNDELDRTFESSKSKNSLRYKATRQKLTREELIGLQKIKKNPNNGLIRNMTPQQQTQPQPQPQPSPSPSPLPTASRRRRQQENIISPAQSVASQQQPIRKPRKPRATKREISELL